MMNGNRKYDGTLDERRQSALADADNAEFSRFHVIVCLVAGVGFFTDAYDIFAINIASEMLGYVYRSENGGMLSSNQDLGIKMSTQLGILVGQLLFGWLADIVGRKKMYGVELMIIIVGTLGQATAGQAHGVNIFNVLIMWRFIMGIGIGGDYPLSAVIPSEFAGINYRGRLMSSVVAAQGWGQFSAALVSLIIISAYKNSIINDNHLDPKHVDNMWRFLIGLGIIPACLGIYSRLNIPETPRFTMDVDRNFQQAQRDVDAMITSGNFAIDPDTVIQRVEAPKASLRDFFAYFSEWENAKVLIGTAYSWFAVDIAFYGLGLNSTVVFKAVGFGANSASSGQGIYETLRAASIGNIILSLGGLIPGYYATFLFIDRWGRKPIQLMGFILSTIIFCCMGFGYRALIKTAETTKAFVFLYCIANFFLNFGPNTTTFIVPGEVFPTRYRCTAHGISAATGKLGAIIAQIMYVRLKDTGGKDQFFGHILEIFAFFMLTGIFSTLLIPETKEKSLEELSNETQDGFVRGVSRRIRTMDGILLIE